MIKFHTHRYGGELSLDGAVDYLNRGKSVTVVLHDLTGVPVLDVTVYGLDAVDRQMKGKYQERNVTQINWAAYGSQDAQTARRMAMVLQSAAELADAADEAWSLQMEKEVGK